MLRKTSPGIIIAALLLFYLGIKFFIIGITTIPTEGDSLHIHIPIARAILTGTISSPHTVLLYFYPGTAEIVLALFMLFSFPLNLFNWVGIGSLFIVSFFLGKAYRLPSHAAFFFAFIPATLYGVLRYITTQKIDIWMLVFYAMSMVLLKKPGKSIRYFFVLGICLGMLTGSKYSGPFFAGTLLFFFGKNLRFFIRPLTILASIIPFLLLGVSWYIRNLIFTGNPLYPQPVLFFPGVSNAQFIMWPYWKILLTAPGQFVNMLVSEYMIWSVLFIGVPIFVFVQNKCKQVKFSIEVITLMWLSIATLIIFLLTPAPPLHSYTALVFGARYAYPFLLTAVLSVFLVAQKMKWLFVVYTVAIINTVVGILFVPYHPKLLFFFVPVITGIIIFLEKMIREKKITY